MDTTSLKTRLNIWFQRTAGGDQRPVRFDIDRTYPTLRVLDHAYPAIRREALGVLEHRDEVPAYHDLDPDQADISASTPRQWRVFYLWAMGERAGVNARRCPETVAALDCIPNLFQAFFSVLEAGKSVPAHTGPYSGYLRYHLGLVVPGENPPRLRVRDWKHTWAEGQSVLFDDSWDHEVYNDSDEDRVILIADVLRPMPLPQHLANRTAAVMARHTYGKRVLRRVEQQRGATVNARV
ncbi:hypothetical protein BAY61_12180 [Prauserella marina]|uniref:Aspartate beta-hydroxylase/beta-hydroxylase n=1 Tax=Prauserella marina TaxID=530584 RepID=A0A222VNY5_9PSEU|nr:aspartyl/asparaginyl beta-hydroxylase domain-containing protein [Prauserella marina]ASR35629.1 hypothetical protein BAY61_12180 [Prauserella marina]PWV84505.1 aspartate beta-hydroxylase/beta-hydroxylase [Prauserella marina]SDC20728.1 aspartate beta-hydroxylase/beta-hydroxylase [Prauserella marina]